MNFLPSHDNRLTQASLLLPLRPMTSWRWPTGRLTLWLMRWGENWASARLSWVESRLMCAIIQRERLLQSRHSPKLLSNNTLTRWLTVNQHAAVFALKWDVSGWLCLPPAFVPLCIKPAALEFNWKKWIFFSASSTPLARGKNLHYSAVLFQSISDCSSHFRVFIFFVEFIPLFYILNLLQ